MTNLETNPHKSEEIPDELSNADTQKSELADNENHSNPLNNNEIPTSNTPVPSKEGIDLPEKEAKEGESSTPPEQPIPFVHPDPLPKGNPQQAKFMPRIGIIERVAFPGIEKLKSHELLLLLKAFAPLRVSYLVLLISILFNGPLVYLAGGISAVVGYFMTKKVALITTNSKELQMHLRMLKRMYLFIIAISCVLFAIAVYSVVMYFPQVLQSYSPDTYEQLFGQPASGGSGVTWG